MTQIQRIDYLIDYLLKEGSYKEQIPLNEAEKRQLLRALVNVRNAKPIPKEVLQIEDEYLQRELKNKKITTLSELKPIQKQLYLWQGDITTLEVDGIVNAANSAMLGCFVPNHRCIDNAIHTNAGMKLRLECDEIMRKQNKQESTGSAKITKAYNLPSKYVLHTVGPIITSKVTKEDEKLLESCYESCLNLASKNGLTSLAFCCISTGEFRFPNEKAAIIAVDTVRKYLEKTNSKMKVVFNVFTPKDKEIYERLFH